MTQRERTERVNICLTPSMRMKLRDRANAELVTQSAIVRAALGAYLGRGRDEGAYLGRGRDEGSDDEAEAIAS